MLRNNQFMALCILVSLMKKRIRMRASCVGIHIVSSYIKFTLPFKQLYYLIRGYRHISLIKRTYTIQNRLNTYVYGMGILINV